jgi:alkylhydroperoxidase family enzyme
MANIAIPVSHREAPIGDLLKHYAPHLGPASLAFGDTVYQEISLPFRLVEAARYRTAQINGCLACQAFRAERDLGPLLERHGGNASHSFISRGDPTPDEEFYAEIESWRTSTKFSERERLAIDFAERMGIAPHAFDGDEGFWERMHANFDNAEIVELTLAIGCWIAMGRTLHALGIDPAVCGIPSSGTPTAHARPT